MVYKAVATNSYFYDMNTDMYLYSHEYAFHVQSSLHWQSFSAEVWTSQFGTTLFLWTNWEKNERIYVQNDRKCGSFWKNLFIQNEPIFLQKCQLYFSVYKTHKYKL